MTFYKLVVLAGIATGIAVGVGAYTFVYAKGGSYLTNDPAACANCHVMSEHYDAWLKSSHGKVATCNDCHTPHDNIVAKYMVKASNGFWHSFGFTTGRYPDPLRIKQGNHEVTEHACRYCHQDITAAIESAGHAGASSDEHEGKNEEFSCVRCHKYVGHWVR